MSVAGILSRSLFNFNTQNVQNKVQQFKQEFQKLGMDLQSGNLSAAQVDLASLQQSEPQANSTSSAESNDPIGLEFKQLSQDLQSGNVSAAQQNYAKIQQDFQNQAAARHGHHHHQGGGSGEASAISQLLQQLGQDLQSGNLTGAQKAYGTMQQQFALRQRTISAVVNVRFEQRFGQRLTGPQPPLKVKAGTRNLIPVPACFLTAADSKQTGEDARPPLLN